MSPVGHCQGVPGAELQTSSVLPGAVDLAAKSAGIIPGSPLPVLDTEGLSGISPLSSDEVTASVAGQDLASSHQNGDSIPAVGVSTFRLFHTITSFWDRSVAFQMDRLQGQGTEVMLGSSSA